jgi:hypothetical protein
MFTLLRLTAEERRWNDYYPTRKPDGSVRLGVLLRRYAQTVSLSSAQPTAVLTHFTSRRSRVWCVTWSGDVYGLRVKLRDSTGESYLVDSCHLPTLSGVSPHSPLSVLPILPPYPAAIVPGDAALQSPPRWQWLIEPNIVLPGLKQLLFEYSLENTSDPALAAGGAYRVTQVVHAWEFPGYQGGAM